MAATYACLSHCWGKGSELLCTTSSNRQAFQTHIFWNSLPRTFQDAISIARQLGLSFIWIDALCIIQDDSLDWQQQSAVMADIYHNAYITIAAAASANASGGCYTPKSGLRPYQFRKHLATIHFPDGIKRKVFPVRTNPHYSGDFPLLQRGWVYQERMLSPRVLYFAGDELIWECHARLDCECGSLRTTTYAFGRAQLLEPKIDQLDSWTEVLRQYTALSLTYPSDAFPALSGIAKAYQKVYSDTYVAGIWAKCLPEMLLWYFRTSPDILNINTDPWRAPSWSWASQNWNRDLELLPCQESVAKVKDILCEPSGVDPTGQLATAHLTLMTKAL
ncbi:HET-domain-containing protein, partial [Phaeosphaeriaceae sp. SRC1lsM3a]